MCDPLISRAKETPILTMRRILPSLTALPRLSPFRVLGPGLAVAAAIGSSLALWPWIENRALERSANSARLQLDLVQESLDQRIKRFRPLPQLISQQGSLLQLLEDTDNSGLVPFVNEQLRLQSINIGAADVFLMDPHGTTVATSNYRKDRSFLGKNFSFRPYFSTAMTGATAQFHGLGTTSGERGFFFSAPVLSGTAVVGVLAIKMTVDEIDAQWTALDHEVLVADNNGVVFMAGRPDWHFRTLAPVSAEMRANNEEVRQFPPERLVPLIDIPDIKDGQNVRVDIKQTEHTIPYYAQSAPINLRGWHVVALTPTAKIRAEVLTELAYWCMAAALLILSVATFGQRHRQRKQMLAVQRSERDLLEQRVQERTLELKSLNTQLVEEIGAHQRAETELRKTQKELIQAGKLASLGQMSAALSHEINQPLAAIRSYAGNAVDYLDRDRQPKARENLVYISDMADRISRISKHLTNFARRSGDKLGAVSVKSVVDESIALVQPRLRAAGGNISFEPPDDGLEIIGGHLRLQQVMINLLSNAIDANAESGGALVSVSVEPGADTVSIVVRDNGPGLPSDTAGQVFDPFFTTKDSGGGLGLGLSISFNIIEDFGGKISASNAAEGGAVFRLILKRAGQTV